MRLLWGSLGFLWGKKTHPSLLPCLLDRTFTFTANLSLTKRETSAAGASFASKAKERMEKTCSEILSASSSSQQTKKIGLCHSVRANYVVFTDETVKI